MAIDLDGPRAPPLEGGRADALLVLLHGIGANGDDLIDLALHWRSILPRAEFLSLNAPFPCDFAPDRRQWFSVADRAPAKMLAGARDAARILDPYLDRLLEERRLAADRMALIGFSQGAMMALYVGLRRTPAIAGIVAFSGALLSGEFLHNEISAKPPVILIHGDADEIVPFDCMAHAKACLEAEQVAVEAVTRPGLGHGIDEGGILAAGAFLRRALAPGCA
jgi:phospholipase/carboxylesterase